MIFFLSIPAQIIILIFFAAGQRSNLFKITTTRFNILNTLADLSWKESFTILYILGTKVPRIYLFFLS